MKIQDITCLLVLGAAIWFAGTLYYAFRGTAVLETTAARYWANFVLCPVLSAAACIAILRLWHIPADHWTAAALLLALPGLVGEAVVLSSFATFMPRLQVASAGRYGAFLFAAYALVLGIAETVTLRAIR